MSTFIQAIYANNLALVQSLYDQGQMLTEELYNIACHNEDATMLNFLFEKECPMHEEDIMYLPLVPSRLGKLNCLRYLIEQQNYRLDGLFVCGAAQFNRIDCVQYLLEKGCPTTSDDTSQDACYYAVFINKNLDLLKLLHSYRAPLESSLCYYAAECGRVDILQYLYENRCHMSEEAGKAAVKNKYTDCLLYFLQHFDNKQDFIDKVIFGEFLCLKINLDNPDWRKILFHLNLDKQPTLQKRVNAKNLEIEKMQETCMNVLYTSNFVLPKEVIQSNIFDYF